MLFRLYVFLMVALFLLGPLPSRAEQTFAYLGQGYEIQLHDFEDRQVVVYRGEIMPLDGTKPLKKMLAKLVPGKNIEVALGKSAGGERDSYVFFGESLRKACPRSSCKITTYARNFCASACVWLFMYGDDRVADPRAIFGFHRAFVGTLGIQLIIQSKKNLKDRFVVFGADPVWMEDNIKGLTAHQKNGVFATAEQMLRANIATEIDPYWAERTMTGWPSAFLYQYGLPDGANWLDEINSRP